MESPVLEVEGDKPWLELVPQALLSKPPVADPVLPMLLMALLQEERLHCQYASVAQHTEAASSVGQQGPSPVPSKSLLRSPQGAGILRTVQHVLLTISSFLADWLH